jgi:chemotaxis signal transduction protein
MSKLLVQSQSRDSLLQPSRQIKAALKLIVFSIGNLHFALRIESVYKVVERTPVYSSGLNHVGVAHMGDSLRDSSGSREVTVVDLNWQFFQSSSISESGGYLVIVQNTTDEFYGIPVANTPALMEVPLSMFRVLPDAYRRADTLEVASHVAVIPQGGVPLTVFLLDVQLLLPVFQKLAAAKERG